MDEMQQQPCVSSNFLGLLTKLDKTLFYSPLATPFGPLGQILNVSHNQTPWTRITELLRLWTKILYPDRHP